MILDALYMFDGTQTSGNNYTAVTGVNITANGIATQASTNVIDLGTARDMGIGGYTLKVMCLVTTAFTSTGAGTMHVQFQGSTDNTTYATYAQSANYASTTLTAGTYLMHQDVPAVDPTTNKIPRYLRLVYSVGTSQFSTGAVIATMVIDRQDNAPKYSYPSGFVVNN